MNEKKRKFIALTKSLLPESLPSSHTAKRQRHSQENSDESLNLSELGKSIMFTKEQPASKEEEKSSVLSTNSVSIRKFDGNGIFINKVKHYKQKTPNMLTFKQIFMKDPNDAKSHIDCQHAILTTFEYE